MKALATSHPFSGFELIMQPSPGLTVYSLETYGATPGLCQHRRLPLGGKLHEFGPTRVPRESFQPFLLMGMTHKLHTAPIPNISVLHQIRSTSTIVLG